MYRSELENPPFFKEVDDHSYSYLSSIGPSKPGGYTIQTWLRDHVVKRPFWHGNLPMVLHHVRLNSQDLWFVIQSSVQIISNQPDMVQFNIHIHMIPMKNSMWVIPNAICTIPQSSPF